MAGVSEINFDGLVGPTHNYAGLSFGNVASAKHAASVSRPREAALQGLAKMKFLHDLGIRQGVLPPHPRPDFATLRSLGFSGNDAQVLERAAVADPRLLAAVYSSSSMWTANAATISPSADSGDGRVHLTPANLISQFHRSIEAPITAKILQKIFADPAHFVHHDPLPAAEAMADEGAANHVRLAASHEAAGLEIFVYGRSAWGSGNAPKRFPARQTRQASEAIARRHGLSADRTLFVQQSAEAIDAGAFHNDVVAVGNENVLLVHGRAYEEGPAAIEQVRERFNRLCGQALNMFAAGDDELTLTAAVQTYLFNSQVVTLGDGTMTLIAPLECREHAGAQRFIQRVVSEGPIRTAHYLDVRQSMKNGGGPACLRLRVVLTGPQLDAVLPGVMMSDGLFMRLADWIQRRYREEIAPADLRDPQLGRECCDALEELTGILGLGAVYPFQQ